MRRLRTVRIVAASALMSGVILRCTEYPDSLFACLAAGIAVEVVESMLRMCDRLLDPPPPVFLLLRWRANNLRRYLDIGLTSPRGTVNNAPHASAQTYCIGGGMQ